MKSHCTALPLPSPPQVRLDMAVDCPEGGAHLQVVEVEAAPMPLGPGNPHGIGFDVTERVLRTEQEAQRNCAPERSRVWKARLPLRWLAGLPCCCARGCLADACAGAGPLHASRRLPPNRHYPAPPCGWPPCRSRTRAASTR